MIKKIIFLAKYIDSGGVSSIMMELGIDLIKNNWEVFLISGGQNGVHKFTKEAYEDNGIVYINLPYLREGILGFVKLPFTLWRFLKIIKTINPTLIHVHWRSVSIYAKIAELFLNIPFISTIHSNKIPSNLFYKFVSFWGKNVIVISTETGKFMHDRFNIPYTKQTLIFNGVDDCKFRVPTLEQKIESRNYFNIEENSFVICCLARLEEVKGHKIIIEAIKRLPIEIRDNFKVLFAGEGSFEDSLRKKINNLELQNNFIFLGHTDSYRVLKASDLFILMSYKEGFPVSIPEAMLSGVSVIRSPAEGAYDQIENNKTGFIVDFDDSYNLSKKIVSLYNDPSLLSFIAENANKKAKKYFTRILMGRKTINLYNSIK